VVSPDGTPDERIAVPPGDLVGGNGVVEPRAPETKLAASIAGRIAAIHVREGETVTAGTPLVELETAVARAALDAAEAEVAVARAELARHRRGSRSEDIEAADAEAEAAVARALLSEGVRDRLDSLAPSGAVTTDELDRTRRQAEADRHAADTAAARRRATLAGSRSEDIRAAAARLAAAEARRDQARASLEQNILRAPIDGEVLAIKYRVGELFAPGGDPLVVLGDTSRLRVRMDVDERDVARVREGAAAFVTVDAFPGRRFEARVVDLAHRMGRKNIRTDDPTERLDTKVLETVLELTDPAPPLVPGMRAMTYIVQLPDTQVGDGE
jgi:ABC exporter DevB family membrane fusion protein